MITSFILYTLFAIILYYLGRKSAAKECGLLLTTGGRLSFWTSDIVLALAFFSIICGIRYNVGVDYLSYMYDYVHEVYGTFNDKTEFGFSLICRLLKSLGFHYTFQFAFWGFLQLFFVYYACRNRRFLLPYIGLCLILGNFYLSWMNGIRQTLVACAFVFMIEYILDRKWLKYIIGLAIAFTIHRSSALLIVIYPLLLIVKDFRNRNLALIIAVVCAVLGMTPTWIILLNRFDTLLMLLGYEKYANELIDYTSKTMIAMDWGPRRIGEYVASLAIIWFYNQMREYYREDRFLPAYYILFFIGFCSFNLFANTGLLFIRPTIYFTIFMLPMLAYLMNYLYKTKRKIPFLLVLVTSCTYTYLSVISAVLNPPPFGEESITFKFFWNYL